MGVQKSWKMSLRRLDPREIDDLCDVVETKILEKIRSDFISEMELMKNDIVTKIMRVISGVPRNVGVEDGYEEDVEDFEVVGSNCEDITDHLERPMGNRVGQFARPRS